jgi:UDPglucose 6-dehydrogenase
MNMDKISLVGLGKLGICLAACYAHRGVPVLGVDIERSIVDSVNAGKAPWFEPGLDEYLQSDCKAGVLEATTDIRRAIQETDLTIILVATPSNPDGSFSNRFIEKVLSDLADEMNNGTRKLLHSFVISSTVMPGSIEKSFIPLLEKKLGPVNERFTICYDPDFVALGNVIQNFLHPDFILIGESCKGAGEELHFLHAKLCCDNPPVHRMSLVSAEIAKVVLNAYITTKISFANSVSQLCEKIPGADVDAITKAVGTDKRIGSKYFTGGTAFGGTCFPRDVHAYISLAENVGVQSLLVRSAKTVNEQQNSWLIYTVMKVCEKYGGMVGILGASFVPNTPVVTESPSIILAQHLVKLNNHLAIVSMYDPVALDSAKNVLGSNVQYMSSVSDLVNNADILVIMHRDLLYKGAVEYRALPNVKAIVDCWRLIDPSTLPKTVEYIAVGKYHEEIETAHS